MNIIIDMDMNMNMNMNMNMDMNMNIDMVKDMEINMGCTRIYTKFFIYQIASILGFRNEVKSRYRF
jgi:hypothetical protein